MDCDELMNFVEEYTPYWQKLKVFFLLKTALSPVIETMVLLDRLLFLHEQVIMNYFAYFLSVVSQLVILREWKTHLKNVEGMLWPIDVFN